MRKIDYYLGRPLCAFLTLIEKSRKIRKPKKIKRILFIELSEMGSTILMYNALKRVKKDYPEATLYFLIFEKNKESLYLTNQIAKNNIITIKSKSLKNFLFSTIKTLIKIKKLKFDIVFDMELFSRFTAILTYVSNAPNRVGFSNYTNEGLYRGNLFTKEVWYNPYQHIAQNFLNMVDASSRKNENDKINHKSKNDNALEYYKLKYSKEKIKKIKDKNIKLIKSYDPGQKIILINPDGGVLPIRSWPLENYIDLLKKLEKNYNLLIIGKGRTAKDSAIKIKSKIKSNKVTDLTNKTNFKELIDLFFISDVLIGNDGGLAHFATLSKIKIITFFGPETPKLYGPLSENAINIYNNFSCSPCLTAYNHRKTKCTNQKCLKTIKVDEVYRTIIISLK